MPSPERSAAGEAPLAGGRSSADEGPAPGDEKVGELARALRLSITRLARRLRQQDGNGLGPTVMAALVSIRRHGGPTHGELAAMEQLAPPTITAIVAKMEGLGLVTREVDQQDRRVTRIRIAPAGAAHLDDVRNRRTEWLESQLRCLTPGELRRLSAAAEVLVKLIDLPDARAAQNVAGTNDS